ncbi:RNase H domain-containing protein [Trichonephila clavipes]|nr:RNase H domain-containing protein [Trichonephila clavipes]
MKFSEGRKSFEMCTNCSSEPATPAHILECLGLTKQDLADVPLLVLDFLKVAQLKFVKGRLGHVDMQCAFAKEAHFSISRSVTAVQCAFRRNFDIPLRGRVPDRKCILMWVDAFRATENVSK